jgi:hypothetical protein
MWCRGPQGPDYVCAAGRAGRCPLTVDADIVIVDVWLESDMQQHGIASWHLIRYYRDLGLPVLALTGPGGPAVSEDVGAVLTLPRRAPASTVAAAALSLADDPVRQPTAVATPSRRTATSTA